jgi:hypothetical protein
MKAAALLILIGLAVGLIACKNGGGGSNALTIDEYIQQVLSTDQAHESRANPLRTQLDQQFQGLADDAAVPPDALTALNGLVEEEATFTADVSDIKPPDEAEALHQEAIDALQAEHDLLATALGQVSASTTFGELNQAFGSNELTQAGERRTNACLAIQQFATDNGVEANLTC